MPTAIGASLNAGSARCSSANLRAHQPHNAVLSRSASTAALTDTRRFVKVRLFSIPRNRRAHR